MGCAICGGPVALGEGIACYLCGRPFHFSRERACGYALPNPYACCGLVYACATCAYDLARELTLTAIP